MKLNSNQKEIQQYLREKYKKDSIKWPSHIKVEIDKENEKIKTVKMTLTKEAIGLATKSKDNKNMQDNDACFEGWAVALKAAGIEKINLNVNGISSSTDFKTGKGHYGRFLYRALRFSEQYEWFHLCGNKENPKTLKGAVKAFDNFLTNKNLYNNVPDNIAGKNGKIECYIEALMASNDGKNAFLSSLEKAKPEGKRSGITPDQQVNRQLPVGLFLDEVTDDNQIFTGGASAIDLWTLKDNVLQVIELKADNPMVGIITEIFFYSNYMYDLMNKKEDKDVFSLTRPKNKQGDGKNRGYDVICEKAAKNKSEGKITKIEGFMLANDYHPLITNEVVDVLKNGNKSTGIEYFKAEYDFDVTIKKNKRTR